jgi:hypothetical protein
MYNLAAYLIASSTAITLLIGVLHLLYTFYCSRLSPRDAGLRIRMQEVSPIITRQTTMWKAWVGFNATHSFGLILFGAMYGYLTLMHPEFLLESTFLLLLGLITLLGYLVVAKRYFFRAPFRLILVSSVLYVLALISRYA